MNRREYLYSLAALGITATTTGWTFQNDQIMKRKIPGTGEELPVVGVGTWITFDVGSLEKDRKPLKEVLTQLVAQGGSVMDSSPMYGRSEQVVGDLSTELDINQKLFMATKVWTSGREAGIQQMNTSFELLHRDQMDLMQVHNLVDFETHFKTLQQWKEEERIRYIGITHYTDTAHSQLESIIRQNPIDFVQVNYSIDNQHAANSLFKVAQERNVAVIVNQPFGGRDLFDRVANKVLPEWTKEFDCASWGCFFLKFILTNPAVTCVIPGTSKLKHMIDNLSAGVGRLPDETQRKKMIEYIKR